MVDIPVNPEVKELPPLSDAALFKMYSGLEVPNFAAIRSMVREIQTARARPTLMFDGLDTYWIQQGPEAGGAALSQPHGSASEAWDDYHNRAARAKAGQ